MDAPDREDVLLPVEAGGLKLRNPFIVASGPTAKTAEQLVEAETWGWAGACIKLTMDPSPYVNLPPRYRWLAKRGIHIFTAETRLELEEGLRLIEQGRRRTREIVLFANFAYTGKEGVRGWVRMAKRFEEAGAHALELNLCCPNMSFNVAKSSGASSFPASGASIGTDPAAVGQIVRAVKPSADVPVFAKISPEAGNIADVAAAAFAAGADGVTSVANRLGMPPFDPHDPAGAFYRAQRGMSLGCLSGPVLAPLGMRDVFEIRKRVGGTGCIVGTGGVASAKDAVRFAMCGADLVGICTQTMVRGFAFLPGWIGSVKEFLAEEGLGSWRELRDGLHEHMRPASGLDIVDARTEVNEAACTGCGLCLAIGHCFAISMTGDKKAVVDPARCTACSTCMDVCKVGALRMVEDAVVPGRPEKRE